MSKLTRLELQMQLPVDHALPFDSTLGDDVPRAPEDVVYSVEPQGLFTIPLAKAKYTCRQDATTRAYELCKMRGLRLFRMFETQSFYVAHVYAVVH